MSIVSPELVDLLQRLFAARHVELAQALQRREWSKELVLKLPPYEHADPDHWYHALTQQTQLENLVTALFALLRELRRHRVREIDEVAALMAPPPSPRDRYAALLRGQLNKLPDVFRVCGGPISVEAVYVEVTLATSEHAPERAPDAPYAQGRGAARKLTGSVKDLRSRAPLSRVLAHAHRRWGLLGDPGSGKTTLLRHVAVELLSRADGPLPIYLKVAELTNGLKKAISTLCDSFNTPELAAYVLAEARAGRAVLLIDGLDEAPDPHAARKWVCGAAADVGESQVVVASRPIGYTEPSADFYTLTLCPLGAEQQAELLTRWVTDAAKVHRALERLSRTPRLRRLAESPLLLTLVGLLLRAGQDVPSRRGELYERALKLLLTRDHDAEGAHSFKPIRKPTLTLELLSGAALRLHGLEGEAYRRDALIAALEADPRDAKRLRKRWFSPKKFVAEVAERTGLLVPDTGRVKDASAYSFPHRTFRELLAAMALERDIKAAESGASELARVFAEGKARPERWAEVLALTCGRLGAGGADALVQRITQEGNTALLLRVIADAEGISEGLVRSALALTPGAHDQDRLVRQRVIQEIPALVNDLHVAVGLLEQVAKSSTCGHDLYWVRETLDQISLGSVSGPTAEGTEDDARRAARGASKSLMRNHEPSRRAALVELLRPWWREVPGASPAVQVLAVPVTWAMYRLFDRTHDAARCTFDGALPLEAQHDVPVYNVTWCAAAMFAEWVGARLPREDEWELACRAGETTRFWSGDSEEDLKGVAWCAPNSGGHPHPVAQKPANAWGLHDLHGNVMEWCDEAAQDAQPVEPACAEGSSLRGLRGGAWSSEPELAEVSHRLWEDLNGAFWDVGFRLVRTVAPGEADSGAG